MHEDLTSIVKPPPFNEPKNLTIGLPETVGIVVFVYSINVTHRRWYVKTRTIDIRGIVFVYSINVNHHIIDCHVQM